ncbi:hypothetical protein Vadar_009764 [Vaccinium darrowii]|uniref:Uncharacterized protein n=1 Tax=Vaccinium darrowii TaxID=229202 RepID=A0ACB7WZC9_9ERIC|nr:hypothetical protein Vadar_009764 [Vaccinium darrowii]
MAYEHDQRRCPHSATGALARAARWSPPATLRRRRRRLRPFPSSYGVGGGAGWWSGCGLGERGARTIWERRKYYEEKSRFRVKMMTSLPSLIPCFHIADYYPKKEKFSSIKVNGYPSFSKSKIHEVQLSHKKGGVSTRIRAYPSAKNPATMLTKPQNYDEHLHGVIKEDGGYKQIVAIRAFETGPDKAATIQTLFNLLQVKT